MKSIEIVYLYISTSRTILVDIQIMIPADIDNFIIDSINFRKGNCCSLKIICFNFKFTILMFLCLPLTKGVPKSDKMFLIVFEMFHL